MYIHEIVGENEKHPIYKELERTNGIRHYNFLDSIISTSLSIDQCSITEDLIKSINFHAIACLHEGAGKYRTIPVFIDGSPHAPPSHEKVAELMTTFVRNVNDAWQHADPIALASYVMWGINHIHPFVNGNGRTARAMFYYVFCLKLRTKLNIPLPEMIKTQYRQQYIYALQRVDETVKNSFDITPIARLMEDIIMGAIQARIKSR